MPFFRLSLTWPCPEAHPRNRVASFGQVAPGQLLLDPLAAALEVSALVLVPLPRQHKISCEVCQVKLSQIWKTKTIHQAIVLIVLF